MLLLYQTALRTLTLFLLLAPLALSVPPVSIHTAASLTGYVGPLPTPPTGDYLTTTYCYCSLPRYKRIPEFDEGSYFQYEYYNVHSNATFIMHRLCRANHDELDTCVDPYNVRCDVKHDGHCEVNMMCSYWNRPAAVGGELRGRGAEGGRKKVKQDRWCMTLDDRNVWDVGDEIVWNKHVRKLTRKGGQGRQEATGAEAEKVCEGLCRGQVEMPMLRRNKNAISHQEVFTDLDDMCDECRR